MVAAVFQYPESDINVQLHSQKSSKELDLNNLITSTSTGLSSCFILSLDGLEHGHHSQLQPLFNHDST